MLFWKLLTGLYKRAYIAAQWQAKYNLPRQAAAAAAGSTAAAAVHEPQYTSDYIPASVLWLVYCGAALGVELPQFESFYTIPLLTSFSAEKASEL